MNILSVQNLQMSFGDRVLFEGANFEIEYGERAGLIGANGAGKTTLFKLILGQYQPTSGAIIIGKNARLGYMEQHACASSHRTVYDEILTVFAPLFRMEKRMEEINGIIDSGRGDEGILNEQLLLREEYERKGGLTFRSMAESTLMGLGFPKDMHPLTCDCLSGGQRSKLSLGKLLLSGADLILLDEPTNHLDIESVEWLEGFLRDYKGAALIISHDRYFLDRVTSKTVEIEHGHIKSYRGGYTEFIRRKEAEKIIERRHYENTMAEIHRIERIIEQQRQWNRERNIRTAEHKQKSIDRLTENLVKPEGEEDKVRFEFPPVMPTGNDIYTLTSISKSFGDEELFRNVSFLIKKGERVFLLGSNGCGKTTLLKIMIGQLLPDFGLKKPGENVKIGYFAQTLDGLDDNSTVLDEVWNKYRTFTQTQVRNALAAFLFKGDDVFKKIETLSGGEKARVALLKLMLGGYNFLLLDEPTNHLDISSREALEDALAGYEGTMLVVSHDRYFINKLSTRILRLSREGIEEFGNDYNDYLLRLEKLKAEAKPAQKEKNTQNDYKLRKARESEIRRLKGSAGRLETGIAQREKQLESFQKELELPETGADYEKIIDLTQKIDVLNSEIEEMMEEWERTHERLAEIDPEENGEE